MKTLNRPMFRYGGPIKEGVMNGIREPKRNGGSMNRQAALVGNPNFPMQDGRALHSEAATRSALEKIKQAFSMTAGSPKNVVKSLNPNKKIAIAKNAGLALLNPLKNFYKKQVGKLDMPPKFKSAGGEFKGAGTAGGGSLPTSLLERAKYFATRNPKTTGVGAGVGMTSGIIPDTVGAIGTGIKNTGLQIADLLVSDKYFDQDKYLKEKFPDGLFGGKKESEIDESILTAEQKRIKELQRLLDQKNKADDVPTISADEERQNRIQKYRDIMDIKGMNKDAAYNSLIAASRAISGEGDFKGSIRDGSLINKIIGSTSKAFDKPQATKDAIDTLILKGEIEKDINLSKGNASTQSITALANASGKSEKYIANAKLQIANSPGEAKSQLVKLKKGVPTSDDVTAVIATYGEENGIPFRRQFTTEEKNEKVGKGKQFANVTEFMEAAKLDPNGSDDGLYVVGSSVVQVEKGIPKLKG